MMMMNDIRKSRQKAAFFYIICKLVLRFSHGKLAVRKINFV
jgi:hypothetical protein